jgi:hypothetical protein
MNAAGFQRQLQGEHLIERMLVNDQSGLGKLHGE